MWGNANIRKLVTMHRDVYKYTHDQTVRLINAGYTPREIADAVKLPKSLSEFFWCARLLRRPAPQRQGGVPVLHGRLRRQSGQPEPLPPQESAKRYLELPRRSRQGRGCRTGCFDVGDYRWAAELLNHAVFGDPSAKSAKELLARTYEQMGYQAEAATWRNSYLTAAQELRNGPPTRACPRP